MMRPGAYRAFALAMVLQSAGLAVAASWVDRGEYDTVLLIRAEASPEKRVALLDQWKQKYPKTELGQVRRELYLSAYQSLGAWPRMIDIAREMVAAQPGNLAGLYWLTLLTPNAKEPSADLLTAAEGAARRLLAETASQPGPQRAEMELLAHRTLGWIHWRREAYDTAEQEFAACLRARPKEAEISAWYGLVLALQKPPEKQVAALWHLARAASAGGDSALGDAQRRDINALLERLYAAYRGGSEGLDQLRASAAASALPPEGFTIESAAAAAARRQEEDLKRNNPQLAAWLLIRKQLEAPGGEAYFEKDLRGSAVLRFKGALVRCSPQTAPKEIVLAIRDTASEEVILKLDSPFPHGAQPGTPLEFEGTASAFTREPFSLTVTVAREKVEGWPPRHR